MSYSIVQSTAPSIPSSLFYSSSGLMKERLLIAGVGDPVGIAAYNLGMEPAQANSPLPLITRAWMSISATFGHQFTLVTIPNPANKSSSLRVLVNERSAIKRLKGAGFAEGEIRRALSSNNLGDLSYERLALLFAQKCLQEEPSTEILTRIKQAIAYIRTKKAKTRLQVEEKSFGSVKTQLHPNHQGSIQINHRWVDFDTQSFCIQKLNPSLTTEEVHTLYEFAIRNACHRGYISRKNHLEHGLPRSMHFVHEGQVLVHFNRKKRPTNDKEIGKGTSKTVTLVYDLFKNRIAVAASSLRIQKLTQEVSHLKAFKSKKGFVQLEGFCTYTNSRGIEKAKAILEYCEMGDLYSHLYDTKDRLSNAVRKKIFIGIVEAVALMHSQGKTHGDLKPENILLDINLDPRISDLESMRPSKAATSAHTPLYASPEFARTALLSPSKAQIELLKIKNPTLTDAQVINAIKHRWQTDCFNSHYDMWALGAILWELCTNNRKTHLPWYTRDKKNTLKELAKLSAPPFSKPQDIRSPLYLAWEMLQPNPIKRIQADEALTRLASLNWTTY